MHPLSKIIDQQQDPKGLVVILLVKNMKHGSILFKMNRKVDFRVLLAIFIENKILIKLWNTWWYFITHGKTTKHNFWKNSWVICIYSFHYFPYTILCNFFHHQKISSMTLFHIKGAMIIYLKMEMKGKIISLGTNINYRLLFYIQMMWMYSI